METSELALYFNIVKKRAWFILLLVIGTLVGVYWAAIHAPPTYLSVVVLQAVTTEPEEVMLFTPLRYGPVPGQVRDMQEEFSTYLLGSGVAWETIKQLKLDMDATEFLKRVRVVLSGEFVVVRVTSRTPSEAQAIAEAHVNNALRRYRRVKAQPALTMEEFLAQELERIEQELADAQEALTTFRLQHSLESLSREIEAYQELIRSMEVERDGLLVKVAETEANVEELWAEATEKKRRAEKIRAEAEQAVVQAEAAAVEAKELLSVGSPLAGEKAVKARELSAKAQTLELEANHYMEIARTLTVQAATQASMVKGYRAAIEEYNRRIASKREKLSGLLALEVEYQQLERAVRRAQNRYDFFLEKVNEAKLKASTALSTGYFQITQPATAPRIPTRPKLYQMLAAGGAISLLAGIVLSFLWELVESSLRKARARGA